MRPAENVKRLIKNLQDKTSAQMDERVLGDVLHALEESEERIPASTTPSIWRIIMRTPMRKLAAAAVIIIAIIIGIHHFGGSIDVTAPAYGLTDLPELFEQAKVIHIQGWQHFGGHRMPDGKRIRPVEIDNWIDLENGRSRYTGTGLSMDKNGVRITVSETISDGQYKLCLNHTEKYATFFKISNYQQMLNAYHISRLMYGQIFGQTELLQNFEKVGYDQIDEAGYDIWQHGTADSVLEHAYRLKFWLSPDTGKLGRVQMWSKGKDNRWDLNYDYCDIEYDVAVPDEVFAMEVPQDYTLNNTRQTAFPQELGGGGGVGYSDDQCDLSVDTQASFTMSDDSVIVGWCSVNDKSAIPQEELFEGLEFGGPLPKLPVEIYGLKPAGVTSDITYTGYHLTCTQKAGKFIEWSLYVPDATPPPNVRQFGCDVLYTFNLGHEPRFRLALNVDCRLLIETTEDFGKWVLGAMAELSDEGKAPEHVTYASVLQLAEQIRKSLSR
jgi:hypothetical protein